MKRATSNPATKAKSVAFTEEGARKSLGCIRMAIRQIEPENPTVN
jgi:hypothetical protein